MTLLCVKGTDWTEIPWILDDIAKLDQIRPQTLRYTKQGASLDLFRSFRCTYCCLQPNVVLPVQQMMKKISKILSKHDVNHMIKNHTVI